MDFFQVGGRNYLAMVDRYCGWLSVLQLDRDDSAHVISALREYFSRWGIAKELTSDGASVFTSAEIKSFFHRWGASSTACPAPTTPRLTSVARWR